jgi:hypothetical protein
VRKCQNKERNFVFTFFLLRAVLEGLWTSLYVIFKIKKLPALSLHEELFSCLPFCLGHAVWDNRVGRKVCRHCPPTAVTVSNCVRVYHNALQLTATHTDVAGRILLKWILNKWCECARCTVTLCVVLLSLRYILGWSLYGGESGWLFMRNLEREGCEGIIKCV